MPKFAIGGQMDKPLFVAQIDKRASEGWSCEVMSDIQAALAVKNGKADFYVGACATGAGGALGLAIGILGAPCCVSISIPGKRLSAEEVLAHVKNGIKAFGMVNQDIEVMMPILLDAIKSCA